MNNRIIRRIQNEARAADQKRIEAAERIKELRQSIKSGEISEEEKNLPELEGLVTKAHLRHARRVASAGRSFGDGGVDKTLIRKAGYHQQGSRDPKIMEFEGSLLTLIQTYGPEQAQEHFSLGQATKYRVVKRTKGVIEFWNTRTGEREYPVQTSIDRLRERLSGGLPGSKD